MNNSIIDLADILQHLLDGFDLFIRVRNADGEKFLSFRLQNDTLMTMEDTNVTESFNWFLMSIISGTYTITSAKHDTYVLYTCTGIEVE